MYHDNFTHNQERDSFWNSLRLYWLPRSEWCNNAPGLLRRQRAITRASPTSCAVIRALIALHLLLNRRSENYAWEGIDLDVSTQADWVGACAATLALLGAVLRPHVCGGPAGGRLHGDDGTALGLCGR